ncbi:MAG: sigma-70 family RNA polymerase sigma factor [Cetobacterium sp.]|uniref:sigma-70 family RNA polymerase sigma factor n=1 Tax=Cetobacterium sp. TaxID=2071632 RepID=UPI003EE5B371
MEQEEQRIISLGKLNDDEAMEILIKKYRSTIFAVMREYTLYLKGMELDDFIQEGSFGILKAIRYFDDSKEVKFSSFVRLCVKSELIIFVKKYSSKRHNILTDIIYCRKFTDKELVYDSIIEEVYSSDKDNPERILFIKELFKEMKIFLKKELSVFEQEILILLSKGYSYREICTLLKKEPKKIDNTIQRIRQNLKKQGLNKLFRESF